MLLPQILPGLGATQPHTSHPPIACSGHFPGPARAGATAREGPRRGKTSRDPPSPHQAGMRADAPLHYLFLAVM